MHDVDGVLHLWSLFSTFKKSWIGNWTEKRIDPQIEGNSKINMIT